MDIIYMDIKEFRRRMARRFRDEDPVAMLPEGVDKDTPVDIVTKLAYTGRLVTRLPAVTPEDSELPDWIDEFEDEFEQQQEYYLRLKSDFERMNGAVARLNYDLLNSDFGRMRKAIMLSKDGSSFNLLKSDFGRMKEAMDRLNDDFNQFLGVTRPTEVGKKEEER
jgi:hypothetical protein